MVVEAAALSVAYRNQLDFRQSSDGGSSLSESFSASIAAADSTGDAFGAAVTVDLTITDPPASKAVQDLSSAVNTLKQAQKELQDQAKSAAAQKLALALKEIQFLKLLGASLQGAREAVRIAKEIASAAKDYAAAGGQDLPSASTAAAQTPPDIAAQVQQDPFFVEASQGLSEISKYLKQILPTLEAASDKKTRKELHDLGAAFAQATNDTAAAAVSLGIDASSGTTLAAQPVDLVA